jgi:hypothetical protein
MVPIVFQMHNSKNLGELGSFIIEDCIPLCIVVNLDFIAFVGKEDDRSLIDIIVETILHEAYHELFYAENVPACYHHYMINKLNYEYVIQSILSHKTDSGERIKERKKAIEEDISVMYD